MPMFDPYRRCRCCGFNGYMTRWYRARFYPFLITLILLVCGIVPGMIYYAVNMGKLECPKCGHTRK
jgi:hypothetical protein